MAYRQASAVADDGQERETYARTMTAQLSTRKVGMDKVLDAGAHVLPYLFLVSDQGYGGRYEVVPGELPGGWPLWKRKGPIRNWIYSGTRGRWLVGDDDEALAKFECDTGNIATRQPHRGKMPQDISMGGWMFFDGDGWHGSMQIKVYSEAEYFHRLESRTPKTLVLVSDKGYGGNYMLESGKHPNDMPLWRHEGRGYWIFCGKGGQWFVGDEDERKEDFHCDFGNLASREVNLSRLPHEIGRGGWMYYTGTSWQPTANVCVYDAERLESGQVNLDPDTEKILNPARRIFSLQCTVFRAVGLKHYDFVDVAPDPCCIVQLGNKQHARAKTRHCPQSFSPVWGQSFNLPDYAAGDALYIQVLDYDSAGVTKVFGTAEVPGERIREGKVFDSEVHLEQQGIGRAGIVHLRLEVMESAQAEPQKPAVSLIEQESTQLWRPNPPPLVMRTTETESGFPTAVYVAAEACTRCGGRYELIQSQMVRGMPVWRQAAGDLLLYSGAGDRWHIGAKDYPAATADISGDDCMIRSVDPHHGMMPDRMQSVELGAGVWQLRKSGDSARQPPPTAEPAKGGGLFGKKDKSKTAEKALVTASANRWETDRLIFVSTKEFEMAQAAVAAEQHHQALLKSLRDVASSLQKYAPPLFADAKAAKKTAEELQSQKERGLSGPGIAPEGTQKKACSKIQKWYRNCRFRRRMDVWIMYQIELRARRQQKRNEIWTAVRIQSMFRGTKARLQFGRSRSIRFLQGILGRPVVRIQRFWRSCRVHQARIMRRERQQNVGRTSAGPLSARSCRSSCPNPAQGLHLPGCPRAKQVSHSNIAAAILYVHAPTVQGTNLSKAIFEMDPQRVANGCPVWKQQAGEHWLFSGQSGMWFIGDTLEAQQDFKVDSGVVKHKRRHQGENPERMPTGEWQRLQGEEWIDDERILVTAEGPGGPVQTLAPPLLFIAGVDTSDDGEQVDGVYELIVGEKPNGFPVWKMQGGSYWLFSGVTGQWFVAGKEAQKQDFQSDSGILASMTRHNGTLPHEVSRRDWVRSSDGIWEDVEVLLTTDIHGAALASGRRKAVRKGSLVWEVMDVDFAQLQELLAAAEVRQAARAKDQTSDVVFWQQLGAKWQAATRAHTVRLESPFLSQTSGIYDLVPAAEANSFPLWKQRAGSHWIFSGLRGAWLVGDDDELLRKFQCDTGWIASVKRHHGQLPHAVTQWVRFTGDVWLEDKSVNFFLEDSGKTIMSPVQSPKRGASSPKAASIASPTSPTRLEFLPVAPPGLEEKDFQGISPSRKQAARKQALERQQKTQQDGAWGHLEKALLRRLNDNLTPLAKLKGRRGPLTAAAAATRIQSWFRSLHARRRVQHMVRQRERGDTKQRKRVPGLFSEWKRGEVGQGKVAAPAGQSPVAVQRQRSQRRRLRDDAGGTAQRPGSPTLSPSRKAQPPSLQRRQELAVARERRQMLAALFNELDFHSTASLEETTVEEICRAQVMLERRPRGEARWTEGRYTQLLQNCRAGPDGRMERGEFVDYFSSRMPQEFWEFKEVYDNLSQALGRVAKELVRRDRQRIRSTPAEKEAARQRQAVVARRKGLLAVFDELDIEVKGAVEERLIDGLARASAGTGRWRPQLEKEALALFNGIAVSNDGRVYRGEFVEYFDSRLPRDQQSFDLVLDQFLSAARRLRGQLGQDVGVHEKTIERAAVKIQRWFRRRLAYAKRARQKRQATRLKEREAHRLKQREREANNYPFEQLGHAFDALDMDNSGAVSITEMFELGKMLGELGGQAWTLQQTEQIFNMADGGSGDEDKRLDRGEFVEFLGRKLPAEMAGKILEAAVAAKEKVRREFLADMGRR
eukprot:TRINITY_DN121282_c0_g1_i1.p1 TRINITY_DN121282_c0_g1~~TRINITY_DN121282_c0_g1_i1.p1  ORF type:complete len:1831 (-),score=362.40 TRINITY_DN121282_c0_g1_i1:394-5886(-)